MVEKEKEIIIYDTILKEKIYFIRGYKVMLDVDFMFRLNKNDLEYLQSNFFTANISSKSRVFPYAFTEQGIYMLMAVLRGKLAIKQSKALIRIFKQMKDFIIENQG